MLDQWTVHHGQHFLRHGFGRRQEAGAETGDGKHSFANFHRVSLWSGGAPRTGLELVSDLFGSRFFALRHLLLGGFVKSSPVVMRRCSLAAALAKSPVVLRGRKPSHALYKCVQAIGFDRCWTSASVKKR